MDEECCDSGCKPCVLDPEDGDIPDLLNYISGEFRPAQCEEWLNDLSPATGMRIARVPKSNVDDVNSAVNAARDALHEWSSLSHASRADWLDKIADALEERGEEVAQLESLDTGKPISLARNVDAAGATFQLNR